ncbi:MAG: flagellar basal body-associated FliL family protein [Emcibacter sp.]|nr:flagellar basal body-associated FliL family protein [Emcibacter sp.]
MADEDVTEEETPKKGSKKLLIVGLLAGLLLGGGGGFAAFTMMGGGDVAVHEEEVVVEEDKADPQFVKVERMTLPLVQNNRVLGNMVIDFSLEVDGDENKMAVIRALPEIRDAMLRYYSDKPLGKAGSPRNVDYPRLKKALMDISNKVLHNPLVMRVMVVQARQF